jgi:hypothetical protein
MEQAPPPGRTVCHGCRSLTHELVSVGEEQRYRPVLLPGDGTLMREISPGIMISQTCPVCGGTDDLGWMPGFVPPV